MSIQIWAIACASVVGMISEAVVAAYALGTNTEARTKGKPMAFTAAEKGGGQKEL